ncbi:MAG: two-CW domain-containing protein [Fidelibacterota bacterium]
MKPNCWDYMKCGREFGGNNVKEYGVCPAVTYTAFHRINEGYNGGRYCWEIVGTFPTSNLRCSHAALIKDCTLCKFYKLVEKESGNQFVV